MDDVAKPWCLRDTRRRYVAVMFCFFANLLCYADRTNISVAILPMAEEFGWSASDRGFILGSFFFGYLWPQVVAGELSQRLRYASQRRRRSSQSSTEALLGRQRSGELEHRSGADDGDAAEGTIEATDTSEGMSTRGGGKIVLFIGVLGWSLFTVLTPIAAQSRSFYLLLAVRILMGAFEGLSQPAIHHTLSTWVPPKERSFLCACAISGQFIGIFLAFISFPVFQDLVDGSAWKMMFYFWGSMGLVWCYCAYYFFPVCPFTDDHISKAELAEITGCSSPRAAGLDVEAGRPESGMSGYTLWELLGDRRRQKELVQRCLQSFSMISVIPFRAIVVAHFAHNYGYYVLISWLPQYFASLGLDVSKSSLFSTVPYLAMFVVDLSWGMFVDKYLIRVRKYETVEVRKLSQTVAFLGPALFLTLCMAAGRVLLTSTSTGGTDGHFFVLLVLLSAGLACTSVSHSGKAANLLDLAPTSAGKLLGVSNTIATIPGIMGNVLTGYLLRLSHGSFFPVFSCLVVMWICGAIYYRKHVRADPIFP